MKNEARFNAIRTAILAARSALDTLRITLEIRYAGNVRWASMGEQKKLQRLQAAYDRQADRMFALLDTSPRDWTHGVPSYWIAETLTFADAFRPADEALTVDPPKAYSY